MTHSAGALPDLTFNSWFRSKSRGLRTSFTLTGLVGAATICKSLYDLLGINVGAAAMQGATGLGVFFERFSPISVPAFQSVFIAVAVWFMPKPRTSEARLHALPIRDCLLFFNLWRLLWFAWCLLYLFLALNGFFRLIEAEKIGILFNPDYKPWTGHLINPLNNAQTAILFLCYTVLSRSVVEQPHKNGILIPWHKVAVVWAIITFSEPLLVHFAGAGNAKTVSIAYEAVSGLCAAVSLALLVGRLDSKFIDAPAWIVASGFLYSGIQGGYVFFSGSLDQLRVLIMGIALLLKGVLWLFVAWMLESGKLLFYMARIRGMHGEVQKEWHSFYAKLGRKSV